MKEQKLVTENFVKHKTEVRYYKKIIFVTKITKKNKIILECALSEKKKVCELKEVIKNCLEAIRCPKAKKD